MAEDEVMKDADPVGKDDKKPDKKKLKKGEVDKDAELSEEDLELKNNLLMMVERISKETDPGLQGVALDTISSEIRTATTSMTSVPKPLKFLRPHYATLKAAYEAMPPGPNRGKLADVISVLAITTGEEGQRESLKFRLAGHTEEVGAWGHEYVRNLAGEIGQEFMARDETKESVDDLLNLVSQIVPYHMTHNAEPEAVDVLLEVEELDWLPQYVDEKNFARTCLYLVSCCSYLPEDERDTVLDTAYKCYMKLHKYPEAMCMALKMNLPGLAAQCMAACSDPLVKKQMCYLLARQGTVLNFEEGPAAVEDEGLREDLQQIMSNSRLSEYYVALARDLDVVEAKTPDDVYKMHLVEGRTPTGPGIDSARHNLASSLVNAFVNAGFGQDKLVTGGGEGGAEGGADDPGSQSTWIFKNKDYGKISAAASIGMIMLWDVDAGLPLLDKYLYSADKQVVTGALLGVGILCSGIVHENDPALAILGEVVEKEDPVVRCGAILGLGLAYAGTRKEALAEMLIPLIVDTDVAMEVSGHAALALGFVFVGSQHQETGEAILGALKERSNEQLMDSWGKLMALGLGLLFLGRGDACDAALMAAATSQASIREYAMVTVETCAYAGTGDVLKVQEMMKKCGEHITVDDNSSWKTAHQGPAVLGIALVAMAEDLGAHMANRALEHLLQYGDIVVRRGVPLALAMLNVSNPSIGAMDALSRLSHDQDHEVAHNAIIALGILGAGTNNARLAGMLRQLSAYYYKEPTLLCAVRMAQGLVHMGKGLVKLCPYHTEGQLVSGVALAGLLTVMHCCLEVKTTIGGRAPHMLYCLATAMRPRMLMTIDEEGKLLPVPVRVGTAVDVVAQAGRPKTITGFQTHTTPVLLSVGERAELGTQKYLPLSSVLEGIVILKPNPDYIESHE